jgi:tetratricopeptide (TPR) repeat protein
MKTIDFSYFIERYNAGEMDEAEKTWFEKELDSRPGLRKEADLRRRTDSALRNQDVLDLRYKLSMIEKQRAGSVSGIRRKAALTVKYAAVIVLVAALGSLIFLGGNSETADELIEKYYSPYETYTNTRSAGSNINSNYVTALEYYNVRDYKNAALFFSKVLGSDPRFIESTFMHGVSNFEGKNYPVASESFSLVISNDDNLFIEDAEWLLALCHVKTGDIKNASRQLLQISEAEGIYCKKAARLLKKVDNK